LNLQMEMGEWGWPWTDTLSLSLGTNNKCGYIVYSVLDAITEQPVDIVSLVKCDESSPACNPAYDEIVFYPTVEHPEGVYFLVLRGQLFY